MRTHSAIIFVLGVIFLTRAAPGGTAVTRGSERDLWKSERYALVVAVVRDIVRLPRGDDSGSHRATFEPLATLAGSLDPSAKRTLEVTFEGEVPSSSIHQAPKKGAMVLAVIDRGNRVVPDFCEFMPGFSSLVTIDGLGDKRVAETIERLQLARNGPPDDKDAEKNVPENDHTKKNP